jgi:hypothetical protein
VSSDCTVPVLLSLNVVMVFFCSIADQVEQPCVSGQKIPDNPTLYYLILQANVNNL